MRIILELNFIYNIILMVSEKQLEMSLFFSEEEVSEGELYNFDEILEIFTNLIERSRKKMGFDSEAMAKYEIDRIADFYRKKNTLKAKKLVFYINDIFDLRESRRLLLAEKKRILSQKDEDLNYVAAALMYENLGGEKGDFELEGKGRVKNVNIPRIKFINAFTDPSREGDGFLNPLAENNQKSFKIYKLIVERMLKANVDGLDLKTFLEDECLVKYIDAYVIQEMVNKFIKRIKNSNYLQNEKQKNIEMLFLNLAANYSLLCAGLYDNIFIHSFFRRKSSSISSDKISEDFSEQGINLDKVFTRVRGQKEKVAFWNKYWSGEKININKYYDLRKNFVTKIFRAKEAQIFNEFDLNSFLRNYIIDLNSYRPDEIEEKEKTASLLAVNFLSNPQLNRIISDLIFRELKNDLYGFYK